MPSKDHRTVIEKQPALPSTVMKAIGISQMSRENKVGQHITLSINQDCKRFFLLKKKKKRKKENRLKYTHKKSCVI